MMDRSPPQVMAHSRSPLIYAAIVEQHGLGENHLKLLNLVGHNQRVLEVGPASGYMTKVLLEQLGCNVDCVEIDPAAAALAQAYSRRMVVGSIEDPKTLEVLADNYEVAIFGDVLEHLVDPAKVVRTVREKLSARGRVIASIPNVAHWTIRLALLRGKFNYTETGLLDETHLRFFTLQTARSLFESAGYKIVGIDFTRGPMPLDQWVHSERWKRWLIGRFPGLFGFQFIIEAEKA